ncbi:thiolase family protein [Gulosibacter chungangensis]|uniref:Probable acetyl-CoA acetyltransferase n=1 Tax=Gulosibacter chungangensis TaxID=979746 RepID=A0A7J5BFU7_9MICO|nr:thiolase family protein [Gulosibacter chungangensis]KAB1645156.1 thiolase family protein [Gulosibacter chungangensis]
MTTREKVVIVGGARTPIGSFGGALAGVDAYQLGAAAVTEALARSGVDKDSVDEVIMGCISQVGPDAYNARRVSISAGLSHRVPAFNVNRLCGSGLQAIWSGAQELLWGGTDVVVAGGNESMSRTPFLDFNARGNRRLGDRTVLDGTVAILTDPFSNSHMGVTAENVAAKYGVSRAEQDEFALESQRRAASEAARAAFAEEIVAVTTGGRKPVEVSVDEHPRPDTTLESLAGLKPVFTKDGSVTAGNASGINDGAAATVLLRENDVRERGLGGLATIEAVATAGNDPELMGYAPVVALEKLWQRTGLTPKDVDVVELNEAFASQAVAVIRDAGLDPEKTNPYGGAIALGHPVGATGAILTLRAALDLQRRDLEYAVVTMCIGGGQALAALIRRWEA